MLETNNELCLCPDAELVARTRTGNREAFNVLLARHYRICLSTASLILRDRGDAQDEVQEACFKAFEHLDQYRGEAEFRSWLVRIVSNQCLMLIRSRRRAPFLYLDADSDREGSMPAELASVTADPEHEFMGHEMREILQREIDRIPPLLRKVLVLRDVQDLPMLDVAAHLNITVPAAKSRLLRARIELRERITRRVTSGSSSKFRSDVPKSYAKSRRMRKVPNSSTALEKRSQFVSETLSAAAAA
jgi:RNA polymerase sigma-70 factor, ECF subfamily